MTLLILEISSNALHLAPRARRSFQQSKMNDNQQTTTGKPPRLPPWNKGKLIGAKPPLRPSHVWSIRTKMQMAGRTRDLACGIAGHRGDAVCAAIDPVCGLILHARQLCPRDRFVLIGVTGQMEKSPLPHGARDKHERRRCGWLLLQTTNIGFGPPFWRMRALTEA